MTSKRRCPIAWFAALCLVLTLAQPGGLLAQDDDGDDDDDDVSVPGGAEDDNDDDTDFEDDGNDDDVPAPPPPPLPPPPLAPAPAPAVPAPDDDDDGPAPPVVVDEVPDLDDDRDDSLDREIPNEAIVQLAEGVEPNAFAGRNGATVLRVIPEPNIALLRLDPDEEDDAELRALRADPDLIWGEQNYTSQAPEGRPRYFFSSSTSEPQLVDGPALPEGLDFTPVGACVTGEDVVVAVLDTGVDTDHPALATNVLPNGVNMIENTFDVRDLPNGMDDNNDGQVDELVGHGTHVAGTVLQVAPDAAILPVKVLDSDGVGDTFSVTAGIYYAVEQGADVINLSLSSTYDSIAMQAAAANAASQGVIVVAAVGNGDRSQPLEYPASTDSVISVAATTAGADKASYSN